MVFTSQIHIIWCIPRFTEIWNDYIAVWENFMWLYALDASKNWIYAWSWYSTCERSEHFWGERSLAMLYSAWMKSKSKKLSIWQTPCELVRFGDINNHLDRVQEQCESEQSSRVHTSVATHMLLSMVRGMFTSLEFPTLTLQPEEQLLMPQCHCFQLWWSISK